MRKDKHQYFVEEPGLLGTIWNLVYGIFLFVVVYGGFFTVFMMICIGVITVLSILFDAFRAGIAVGTPYI